MSEKFSNGTLYTKQTNEHKCKESFIYVLDQYWIKIINPVYPGIAGVKYVVT